MPKAVVRRCINCRGERQVGEIREKVYIEPTSGEDTSPVVLQGYICEECTIIHWAWNASDAEAVRETTEG